MRAVVEDALADRRPLRKNSNQMLIRLKLPPSDALGSRWEAGTVPRAQVGCTYASLLS